MKRLSAIGQVNEETEKCAECGKMHEGACSDVGQETDEGIKEAKKPDADGDGVPDWADKKPGKDDNEEKVDEGAMDKLKQFGKRALDTLGHKDDEELIKDMQRKQGLPQTGKKPEPVKESEALAAMRRLAGMPYQTQVAECGDMPTGTEMSPMSAVGNTAGIPIEIQGAEMGGMDTDQDGDIDVMGSAAPEAKATYTLSIQNGENNLQMTTDMPDEIIHIMKLAGVNKGAEVTKTPSPEVGGEEVEEDYGNTPANTKEREPRSFGDIRDWGKKGTGEGKPGYPGTKASGDNPMSEATMMEDYKKFKAGK
jgi:hypothetical protein